MRMMNQPGAAEPRDMVDKGQELRLAKEHQHAIEELAYALWQRRGALIGSSIEDWLEAEKRLAERLLPAARPWK